MERVSPIRLAYKRSWHDFAAAKDQNQQPQLHVSFAVSCRQRSSGLPVALSTRRHGDFPHSIARSKLPVCWLRGYASPAPESAKFPQLQDRNESSGFNVYSRTSLCKERSGR